MSDFGNWREPIARKAHKCEHCRSEIAKGEKHLSVSGRFAGDFYAYRIHFECQEASAAYDRLAGLSFEGERPWLHDLDEAEDRAWLAEKFPHIAARMWPALSAGAAA